MNIGPSRTKLLINPASGEMKLAKGVEVRNLTRYGWREPNTDELAAYRQANIDKAALQAAGRLVKH